jgi:hypothetical protein
MEADISTLCLIEVEAEFHDPWRKLEASFLMRVGGPCHIYYTYVVEVEAAFSRFWSKLEAVYLVRDAG